MPSQQFTPERYRREAARIRRSAAAVPDEDTRDHLLFTARLYDQLADCVRQPVRRRRQQRAAASSAD